MTNNISSWNDDRQYIQKQFPYLYLYLYHYTYTHHLGVCMEVGALTTVTFQLWTMIYKKEEQQQHVSKKSTSTWDFLYIFRLNKITSLRLSP